MVLMHLIKYLESQAWVARGLRESAPPVCMDEIESVWSKTVRKEESDRSIKTARHSLDCLLSPIYDITTSYEPDVKFTLYERSHRLAKYLS